MVPLNLSLRKLLLRNIPKLRSRDLDEYDNLLALRGDYIHISRLNALPADEVDEMTCDRPDMAPSSSQPPSGSETVYVPKHELKVSAVAPLVRQRRVINAIKVLSEQTHAAIRPFERRFVALNRLWMARRRLATQMGSLQQIPSTFAGWKNLLGAIVDHPLVQVKTGVILVDEWLKDLTGGRKWLRWLLWAGIILASLLCFGALGQQFPDGRPDRPSGVIK